MAFTSVAIDGVERPLFGGYTRCIADNSLNDGLAIRTDYRYDSRFGKLIRERFDNVTATGETQGVAKLYGYAFEAYPWFLLKMRSTRPSANSTQRGARRWERRCQSTPAVCNATALCNGNSRLPMKLRRQCGPPRKPMCCKPRLAPSPQPAGAGKRSG